MKYWTNAPLWEDSQQCLHRGLDCQTFAFSCREIRLFFVWLRYNPSRYPLLVRISQHTTLASCNSSSVLKLRLGILVSTLWCVACWCTPMTGSLLAGSTHAVGCNMKSECRGTYSVEELLRVDDVVMRTPWGKDTKHSLLQWSIPTETHRICCRHWKKSGTKHPESRLTQIAAGPQTLQRYVTQKWEDSRTLWR